VTAVAAGSGAAADLEAGKRKAEVCAACHGRDGNATIPGTPSLAGQPVFFTHWQLIKFKDGRRRDPQMTPFVQSLTDADMADLSAYYQTQTPRRRPAATDPAKVVEGQRPPTCTTAPPATAPASPARSKPRARRPDFDYLLRLLRGFAKTAPTSRHHDQRDSALTDPEIVSLVHFIATGAEP
jgi:cytochrome c553